jgi:hypothetical protein
MKFHYRSLLLLGIMCCLVQTAYADHFIVSQDSVSIKVSDSQNVDIPRTILVPHKSLNAAYVSQTVRTYYYSFNLQSFLKFLFPDSSQEQINKSTFSGISFTPGSQFEVLTLGTGSSGSSQLKFYSAKNKVSYYLNPTTEKYEEWPSSDKLSTSTLPIVQYLNQQKAATTQQDQTKKQTTVQNKTEDTCRAAYEKAKQSDGFDSRTTYEVYRANVCNIKTPLNPASADGQKQAQSGGEGNTTIVKGTEFDKLPNPLGGAGIADINGGIQKVMNLVLMVAIPFIVIMIMYSGFLFVAAYGEPSKITKARQTLLWTLVGTALVLGATTIGSAIVNTVKKIGGGNLKSDSSSSVQNTQPASPQAQQPKTGGTVPSTANSSGSTGIATTDSSEPKPSSQNSLRISQETLNKLSSKQEVHTLSGSHSQLFVYVSGSSESNTRYDNITNDLTKSYFYKEDTPANEVLLDYEKLSIFEFKNFNRKEMMPRILIKTNAYVTPNNDPAVLFSTVFALNKEPLKIYTDYLIEFNGLEIINIYKDANIIYTKNNPAISSSVKNEILLLIEKATTSRPF